VCFLFSIWIYWYFINIASTKWYFIRVERNKLWEIKFQNEIVKIDITKLEWEENNNILADNQNNILTWKVINITDNAKITMR